MKLNNESILITDPCYIADDEEWEEEFDYTDCVISTDRISNYLWIPTGFGDGSFSIEQMIGNVASKQELIDYVEDLEDAEYSFYENTSKENEKILNELSKETKRIGDFCVDSGTFCAFLLKDIEKNYPGFFKEYKKSNKIFSVIHNFTGTIDYFTDKRGQNHIIGIGNISFFTNTKNY